MLLHHPTRESVGFFGAVRLRDGKFVYQREDEVFNGATFYSFMKLIRRKSCQAGRRVLLLLDNARYHHARLHKNWRNKCDHLFHCEYLPPYSADLNPIERVWKLTRRLCVHNRYFSKLSELVDLVEDQFQQWEVGNDDLRKLCAL